MLYWAAVFFVIALIAAIFGFGGLSGAALLLAFFLSSSALSRFRESQKETLAEKFSKGSQRDLGQALANGGAAAVCMVLYGVTGHPDHIVVGSATRWAVEKLAESGIAPNAVYVISPIFDPSANLYDLSPEEQAASHRIEITGFADKKLAALECHASQTDTAGEIAALRAAIESGAPIYEGYQRVRPIVPSPHPVFDAALL